MNHHCTAPPKQLFSILGDFGGKFNSFSDDSDFSTLWQEA